jgi:MtrB/PioB family decaheme-associated outer membrane protein
MRTCIGLLTAALLLAAPASAQQSAPVPVRTGTVDLGVRSASVEGDAARYERFRDLGEGAFLERFRFEQHGTNWLVKGGADHAGRRDQRYWTEYRRPGLQLRFVWDQIPMAISGDTRTLYTAASPGVLRLPEGMSQSIQGGERRLADFAGAATPFETRSSRDTAQFRLAYTPAREVDVTIGLTTSSRQGTTPMGAAFGMSNAVEVAAPIDTRTTDLNAGVEWANARGMLRIGYDGSWFSNRLPALIWDNPLRATDIATAGSQGRYALAPGNSGQGVSGAGSLALPARSRLTGSVTVGSWRQNEPLLPFTINTAHLVVPLPRDTADAEARTVAMTSGFTSRPLAALWLSARYRLHDFDNRTPPFTATGMVTMDQGRRSGETTKPLSVTRHSFDADASFAPVPFAALRLGYGREQVTRTFRIFSATAEDVVRASVDASQGSWLTVRGIVERASRTGSGFDVHLLEEVNEQPGMRHYDVADRKRDRVTALVQVTPVAAVGFSLSAAAGSDDYANSGFGLRDNRNRAYTAGIDLSPRSEIVGGLSYSFDRYTARQTSRNANPGAQFVDPLRDWSTDSADRTHTVMANLDLLRLVPSTELKLAYNVSRSRVTYTYGVLAGGPLRAPEQLPPVRNELQTATADARYFLTSRLAVGVGYWFDRYIVDDYAYSPATMDRLDPPGSLFLGYLYRPYTAHSAWLRLTYLW